MSREQGIRKWAAFVLLALIGWGAQAKVSVSVVPKIQFVKQGSSVCLKARARGGDPGRGWHWKILEAGQGILESISFGRVRYLARMGDQAVEPWTTVHVRAISDEDPTAYADATIEVLPGTLFNIIQLTLENPRWIEDVAGQPVPIRLEIIEPECFSRSGRYTFHAEIDTAEEDRFHWQFEPDLGCVESVVPSTPFRESRVFIPPLMRPTERAIRVRVQSVQNPAMVLDTKFLLPSTDLGPAPSLAWKSMIGSPDLHPLFGHGWIP